MTCAGWRRVAVVAAVVASGCGGPAPPESAGAERPAAVDEGSSHEVVLDEEAQREAGIVIERVEARALPELIRVTGRITINENQTWRVGAVTDGRIVQVLVREGDRVEEGQILARLHSHDVHESRAEYRRAVAELDRLQAGLSYALNLRNRTRRLYELKAASLQQLEQAEAELRNAETAVANGKVELERTRTHLEDFLGVPADVPADHEAERGYDEHDLVPIRAPAGGTLLKRNVTAGTVVEPSQDLFVITELSTLWMMGAVNEAHLAKLRIGMPVRIWVQAYPNRSFAGRLAKLNTELDATTRTITARVEVPNSDGRLKPEMYALAELELSGTREAVFVPEVAVQEVEGRRSVFVRTGRNRFEPRAVETAPGVGGHIEVIAGLRPGEEVVVAGGFVLKSHLLKSAPAEE